MGNATLPQDDARHNFSSDSKSYVLGISNDVICFEILFEKCKKTHKTSDSNPRGAETKVPCAVSVYLFYIASTRNQIQKILHLYIF